MLTQLHGFSSAGPAVFHNEETFLRTVTGADGTALDGDEEDAFTRLE